MSTIAVPRSVLESLIDMARDHTQDIESGLAEGLYDPVENADLPAKMTVIAQAEAALSATPLAHSVQVKHWDAYNVPETVMTHQIDVTDQRATSGQIFVDAGAIEGSDHDIMSVTVEINTNPLTGIEQVPCMHVHFDGDALAVSLFKIGSRILVRPETNVSIDAERIMVGQYPETMFWID